MAPSPSGGATGTRGGRRAGRNRPDILRSAGLVIAERGFEETRFSDVAERSGASVSTLQYLFGSREDLLIATLRQTADDFLAAIRRNAESVDHPVRKLSTIVHDMMSTDSTPEQARIDWAVWIEYWRAASRDAELATEAEQTYAEWHALLRNAISPLAQPNTEVAAIAEAATAMIDGFGIQIVLRGADFDRGAASATVLEYIHSTLDPSSRMK